MCWFFHDWAKWTEISSHHLNRKGTDSFVGIMTFQRRECLKCGRLQQRAIKTLGVAP
jgi:hypothetical protein